MSRVERPVAIQVMLHVHSEKTKSGMEKAHGTRKTGRKADKYLYFRGRPWKATAALLRWLEERGDQVELVARKLEIRYLTRDELEKIREDESEVLQWRN